MPSQLVSPRGLGDHWRQGSLIPDAVRDAVYVPQRTRSACSFLWAWIPGRFWNACSPPQNDRLPSIEWSSATLVAITQDCDLCAEVEDEPFVEAFPGLPLNPANKDTDAQCRNGRNPRRLVLDLPGRGPVSIEQWHRIRIPRALCYGHQPVASVTGRDMDILRRWAGRRYTRAAFPDAFNRRIDNCDKGEKKLEKLCGSADALPVSGIYFRCSDDEIADLQIPYKIIIRVVYPVVEDPVTREFMVLQEVKRTADAFAEKLDKVFSGDTAEHNAKPEQEAKRWKGIPGIVIDEIKAIPETAMTLHDLRVYKRFDKDYRSGVDRPTAAVLPLLSENP